MRMGRGIKGSIFFAFFLFLVGCSSEVIQRDNGGSVTAPVVPVETVAPVKKRLLILDFFNESPYGGEDLANQASQELTQELSASPDFVLENGMKETLPNSKEIYSGGGLKLVQLSKRARTMGINLVVYGRVIDARVRDKIDEIGVVRETKSYTEAKVEVRIFDVYNNKEFYSEVLDGYATDSSYRFYFTDAEEKLNYRQELLRYGVRIAVKKIVPRIIETSARLVWVGRVARIVGEKVYINAGKLSGIQQGDVLKVFTEGEEIYDPETGALIGSSKGEVKGTIEIVDFFGPDGSIGILHSGGTVMEGDYLRLY